MSYRVTFVISTRNRPDVLRLCLRSCLAQKGVDPEILVYDDASDVPIATDILTEFGNRVKVVRLDHNLGQPAVRNRGYQEAANEIIVSLDDDTVLFNTEIVKDCTELLKSSNDVGGVAIRYFERPGTPGRPNPKNLKPDTSTWEDISSSTFAGVAVMLRRSAAIKCGLYPSWSYRQGEERFLSIRLLDAGYRIVMHGPPSAIHLYSPVRDRRAMNWYGIRNAILFDWICVPHPYFVPYLMKDIVKLFLYKLSLRNIPSKVGAIGWGLTSILGKWSLRKPVSRTTFRRYLTLPRHGAIPLPDDWSPEPLIKMGVIKEPGELDPFLKPEKMSLPSCSSR